MNYWDRTLDQTSSQGEERPPLLLSNGQPVPSTIRADRLQALDFPPVNWIVRDMLAEGVTLLAGKPKIGKSWLALQLAVAVAEGSDFMGRAVEKGRTLVLALEDNNRRLKSRLGKASHSDSDWSPDLELATEWPKLNEGGLEAIELWLDNHPDARLVVIDTLATVRPQSGSRDNVYSGDYEAIRPLHAIANGRGVGIVVVHHVRKADADDPFDTVSGSTGLTGAADATLVLTRSGEGTVLYGRGRDLAEFEAALAFDAATCRWSDLGRPCEAFGSDTRKAIREALKEGSSTPKAVSEATALDYDLVAKTLQRMVDSDELQKTGRGNYELPPDMLG